MDWLNELPSIKGIDRFVVEMAQMRIPVNLTSDSDRS
jgi:hypothetical protein